MQAYSTPDLLPFCRCQVVVCGQEELAKHVTDAASGKPNLVCDRANCNALAPLMAGCLQTRAKSAAVLAAGVWLGQQSQVGRWCLAIYP